MRTLAFIEWVNGYLQPAKKGTKWDAQTGSVRIFDTPLARASENHLVQLYQEAGEFQGSSVVWVVWDNAALSARHKSQMQPS
jgi:hypothetical protein